VSGTCKVCSHPLRKEIDRALAPQSFPILLLALIHQRCRRGILRTSPFQSSRKFAKDRGVVRWSKYPIHRCFANWHHTHRWKGMSRLAEAGEGGELYAS
jgi:hypothetical protein